MTDAPRKSFVVAVDGPAASGKGTISRRVAARFDFAHLDTGVLYRAVAATALEAGADPADADAMGEIAVALAAADLHRENLRSAAVGAVASVVAAHPPVRAALLQFQRFFAEKPAGGRAGAMLDGRDIGTGVCPEADVKLFVTAALEERARRRHQEIVARGEDRTFEEVLSDLEERDARDAARAASPLRPADDAVLLDTTRLAIDEAVDAATEIIDARWSARRTSQA